MVVTPKTSKLHLMKYLPAIYQETDPSSPETFLGQFLLAFEKVLLGLREESAGGRRVINGNILADTEIESLGEKIARLHTIFEPSETPEEFLPWLAGWAALSLRSDLSSARKRNLLAHIIPLYRIRGTRKYLEQLLLLCLDAVASVSDVEAPALEVGIHSTVGSDTYIDGGPPFFFRVMLVGPWMNAQQLEAQCQIESDVIKKAKPAHTYYDLNVISPNLQLDVQSTIGLDTVIGAATT